METQPYYKLAEWDARSFCFRDGKRAFPTVAEAMAAAKKPGRYRVSTVTLTGRTDGEPFEVAGQAAAPAGRPHTAGGLRTRPGPWTRT